jgi:hypothetical protein
VRSGGKSGPSRPKTSSYITLSASTTPTAPARRRLHGLFPESRGTFFHRANLTIINSLFADAHHPDSGQKEQKVTILVSFFIFIFTKKVKKCYDVCNFRRGEGILCRP